MTDWYEMPSNFSNGTEVNGVGTWFQYISYLTGNWLGYGIVLMLWLVIFGLSMASGTRKALLTSSFITFLLSIYLMRIGIINPIILVLLIVLTIIGAIGSKEEQGL